VVVLSHFGFGVQRVNHGECMMQQQKASGGGGRSATLQVTCDSVRLALL